MDCQSCRHWADATTYANRSGEEHEGEEHYRGECRYNPPAATGWPSTHFDDWCSKFEAKPNKPATAIEWASLSHKERLAAFYMLQNAPHESPDNVVQAVKNLDPETLHMYATIAHHKALDVSPRDFFQKNKPS